MKERPILFSAPMVRAILNGRKTQTRRIINTKSRRKDGAKLLPELLAKFDHGNAGGASPYGVPGDRLWVRETWWERRDRTHESKDINAVRYVVDGEPPEPERWQKRVSIHMPRWASRITLEVTGVRVERLQAITEADAMAEGAGCHFYDWNDAPDHETVRECFRYLWESINGPDSWAANPWVWVIDFKRVTP